MPFVENPPGSGTLVLMSTEDAIRFYSCLIQYHLDKLIVDAVVTHAIFSRMNIQAKKLAQSMVETNDAFKAGLNK